MKNIVNVKPKLVYSKNFKNDTPGFVNVTLTCEGPDKNLVNWDLTQSWSLPKLLAERFIKAVADGKIFHSPTISKTITTPVSTYFSWKSYFFPMGKYLNSDLKKIGY